MSRKANRPIYLFSQDPIAVIEILPERVIQWKQPNKYLNQKIQT